MHLQAGRVDLLRHLLRRLLENWTERNLPAPLDAWSLCQAAMSGSNAFQIESAIRTLVRSLDRPVLLLMGECANLHPAVGTPELRMSCLGDFE